MKIYKIAVVSAGNLDNWRSLSGTSFSILKALEEIAEVEIIDNLKPSGSGFIFIINNKGYFARYLLLRAIQAFWKLQGKKYQWNRTNLLSKYYAKQIKKNLEGKDIDYIVSDNGSIELANLNTTVPIIYLSDTTFRLMLDYYDGFSNLSKGSIRQGENIAQKVINKSSSCIYRSQWARSSAIRDYKASTTKAVVIPNGPNIDSSLLPRIEENIIKDLPRECELLLIGTAWERKGCEVAINAVNILNKTGIKSHLTICGCEPPPGSVVNEHTTIIPFLDKNYEGDMAKLVSLYKKATFFIFPTRAECLGIVLIEACAFGLPIFATDTGAISEIVEDGVNGYLFSLRDNSEKYANKIAKSFQDNDLYRQMSKNAFKTYAKRFNWEEWTNSVTKILEELSKLEGK